MGTPAGGRPLPPRQGPPTVVRPAHSRPDARPMRALIGLTGLAGLSALATALMVPPPAGPTTTSVVEVQAPPSVPVTHVTRYVQLKPGQTAPPHTTVKAAPAATPRVIVVTTTRQSGKP